MLFVTPEVDASQFIRNVEIPKIIQRTEARDGFFLVPLAAGGLDYDAAAQVTNNYVTAQNLKQWNMYKVAAPALSPAIAADIAERVLVQRLGAINRALPRGAPLRLGLFVRRRPPFELGTALALDWSARFTEKETRPEIWRDMLLPALERIASAVRQHAPGREIEAFGIPTLPAAAALGCAFMSTSGLRASWTQVTPGQADQLWTLSASRMTSGFAPRLESRDERAQDIAVLVSVADAVEPLFAAFQSNCPPLRALVHIASPNGYPHRIVSPGEATDIALVVQDGMRTARRQYGNIGTVHLFMAVPAGLAMLIGQLLSTFGAVQTYEHVTVDGSGRYAPAALLQTGG